MSTLAEKFGQTTVIINPVTITQFFEAIYTGIFKQLFVTKLIEGNLLGPVLKYFGTIKTNRQGILYLHYLV